MTYLLTGCSCFLLGYTVATVYRVWCMRQMQGTWIDLLNINNDTNRKAAEARCDREIAEVLQGDLHDHVHLVDDEPEVH